MSKINMDIIHKWVAETDLYISRQADIDRAMVWCEEYLRMEEVRSDLNESFDDDWAIECFDYFIDTCVRYLEKVEAI